tara:strand:+ start:728 stop:1042 length:315 start_codon:yes stop_codon:yes gene_type:complete
MATNSDSKIIDRQSSKQGLADRYLSQKSGGAFDSKNDVKTAGSNSKSIGESSFDTLYTKTKGFKIKMTQGQSEFNEVSGESSLQSSLYMKGFNNRKYSNGSFTK